MTNLYQLLADFVVLLHVVFVVFAVLGGLLVLRWRGVLWTHLVAAFWAAIVEFFGWVCPLTPLENWLRENAGEAGYRSDFIAHYVLPVLYPRGLTREIQIALGVFVVALNLAIYGWLLRRQSPQD
jgi:hypothetical protein